MKKILLIMAVIVGVFSASARDTYSGDVNVLPTAARTILKNNFKSDVNHIKIDKDFGRVSEYDVILNDGSEISFDRNGNWKDIEVRQGALSFRTRTLGNSQLCSAKSEECDYS